MTESLFHEQVDNLMLNIEQAIDHSETYIDIDSEIIDGVQTLTCNNNSRIILSRQTSLQELWLAAKSGSFHFKYTSNSQWICKRSGETLTTILHQCLEEQYGSVVKLELP